jgi:hypothetical protein
MGQRSDLQTLFEAITPNVYFQPPANIQMAYPCIVYKRDKIDTKFADNSPYHLTKRYLVTVIDRNPDSTIPDSIAALPLAAYNRAFTVNNLNHDVFVLYF